MGFIGVVIVITLLCLGFLFLLDISKGKKESSRGEGKNTPAARFSENDHVDESFFIKKINHNDVNINKFNKFAEGDGENIEEPSLEKDPEIEKDLSEMEREHDEALLLERINEINSIADEANDEEFLKRHLEEEGISFTPDDEDLDFIDDEIQADEKRDYIRPDDLKEYLKNNKGLLDFDD